MEPCHVVQVEVGEEEVDRVIAIAERTLEPAETIPCIEEDGPRSGGEEGADGVPGLRVVPAVRPE
jgi:hypothetical protein